MITRIYRVRIKPELRSGFEPLFETVVPASVSNATGCRKVTLGWPTADTPDEYAVISIWDSPEALQAFAGSDWSVPHIPDGMDTYVERCWLHHYFRRAD